MYPLKLICCLFVENHTLKDAKMQWGCSHAIQIVTHFKFLTLLVLTLVQRPLKSLHPLGAFLFYNITLH